MTKVEIAELFGVICAYWPKHSDAFAKAGAPEVNAWHSMLGDYDAGIVHVAFKKYAALNTWPPSPNEILTAVAEIQHPEDNLGADEAWGMVLQAIRKFGYNNESAALESLPQMVAETVKSMGWLELCMSENAAVDRGQFRKAYEARAQRKKTDHQLPPSLKNSIGALQKQMAMDSAKKVVAIGEKAGL